MNYYIINTNLDIQKLILDLHNAPHNKNICLDVETNSENKLVLVQFLIMSNIYILNVKNLGLDRVKYILEILAINNYLFIGHNIKFDCEVIYKNLGVTLLNLYDTMIAEVLINQGIGNQYYSYADLVEKYFGETIDKSVRDTFSDFSGDLTSDQATYAALDVFYLDLIRERQLVILKEQRQIPTLELEMRLLPVVIDMELEGVQFDRERWLKLEEIAKANAIKLDNEIKILIFKSLDFTKYNTALELANALLIPVKTKRQQGQLEYIKDISLMEIWVYENINLASYKQLKAILNLLGIAVKDTNENTLKKYRNKFEIINLLLDLKEWKKKISTYGIKFLDNVDPVTHKLHADINQVGTQTGRFSISKGLHQMPRSDDSLPVEENYRYAVVTEDDYVLIASDYSQIEYKILGEVTGDPDIISAYKRGIDLHTLTAETLKVPRKTAKNINFGMLYGITPYGLYNKFDIPKEEGERHLRNLLSTYKVFNKFRIEAQNFILDKCISRTMYGRIRFFSKPKIYTDNYERDRIESEIKREGFNHIIQGTAADIVKIAMCNIYYDNPFGSMLKIILQVHDEILCKVHKSVLDEAKKFIETCMINAEKPFLGEIPPGVEIKIGDYWK